MTESRGLWPFKTSTAALFVVLACAAAGAAGADRQDAAPQDQQPSFSTGIDLVSLAVTVTDGRGRYVPGLELGDFVVYEDGVPQELTFFESDPQPVALALLLDSSASMEEAMPVLQEAAGTFVRRLTPRDLAQVIEFDTRVNVLQAYTSDQDALHAAIDRLIVNGSTALYTAVYIALKNPAEPAPDAETIRRQALIVFSDGDDTSSLVAFDDMLDLAKRSDAIIYTILLRGRDVRTASFQEAEFVMRQLAYESGGRSFTPRRIFDLSDIYAQIADELSSQYTLGYRSNNPRRDGAWRVVTLQVREGGATARTRRGYFAPRDP